MRIWREGYPDGVIVNPGATLQLQHDDRVDIVSGLPLTCVRCPLSIARKSIDSNCAAYNGRRYVASKRLGKSEPRFPSTAARLLVCQITLLRVCRQLTLSDIGIYVVRTMHPDITHHIVPSHAVTPPHMTSLLSAAHLVKPEWLSELLDLSLLNPRESPRALEHTFALPPEGRFRPGFAAALPSELKTLRSWEPNEARLNMLKGYRFVFAGEKGLEVPAGYREVVKRGGAEYEAFSVNSGVVRWRKALIRAKALAEEKNAKVVLVADGGAMELVVGADEWDEIVSVAKRYAWLASSSTNLRLMMHSLELDFILPENILQAVAYVDTFYVDSAATPGDSQKQGTCSLRRCRRFPCNAASGSGETPLPDIVPNTMEVEPSFVPPVDVRPPRRAPISTPTTSEAAPVKVPSGGEAIPQTTEAPIPSRVRYYLRLLLLGFVLNSA